MEVAKSILFVLCILLALAAAGLVAVGGADGTWKHEGIHRVPHSREDIFEWLSTPDRREQWIEGLRSSKESLQGVREGAVIHEQIEVDGVRYDRDVRITAYEPYDRFAYETSWDGVDYAVTYQLAPNRTQRKSVVNFTCEVQYHGFWRKLIEPVLAAPVRERLYSDLDRLSEALTNAGY